MDNAADPEWGLPVDTLEAAQVIADEYARLAASQPVTEYEKGPG